MTATKSHTMVRAYRRYGAWACEIAAGGRICFGYGVEPELAFLDAVLSAFGQGYAGVS